MAPFRGFVTREPGQGGIRDPPEQESGNREAEQNMFMPLTAESAERLLAVVPLTKIHTADLLELHILEIFGLEYASEPCMRGWGREKYRPPQCLMEAIGDIEFIHGDLTVLSYSRNMVEQLLIHCISEEREIFEQRCGECYPGSGTTEDLNVWPLRMFENMELGLLMRWHGEPIILDGVAAFTLATGDLDGPSSHLVVLEVTSRKEQFDQTYPPGNILGLMAITRLDRKLKGYPSLNIHGILTDGNQFAFSKLEPDCTISRTVYYWNDTSEERESIITSIRDIIRDVVNGKTNHDPHQ